MVRRLLLDVSSLMYRAFYAVPSSVTDPSGRPINAVRGYLDMTADLIRARRPDEVVHAYDHDWRPAPRVAAYSGYKAKRPEEPPELSPQFSVLREVLAALGFEQVEAPGWEAEDAIATLCERAADDDRIDIVTGDRDLIQLVRDPVVRVLFTVKGVSRLAEFDERAVVEKYGVPADRYCDFAILRGDPSDELPGVRGVGEKTARMLVNAAPSLEALIADARSESRTYAPLQRSPRLRADLLEAQSYIETMKDVVPVRRDLELQSWVSPRDDGALAALRERFGLEGPLGRLLKALEPNGASSGGVQG